jgi:hypothetical protein
VARHRHILLRLLSRDRDARQRHALPGTATPNLVRTARTALVRYWLVQLIAPEVRPLTPFCSSGRRMGWDSTLTVCLVCSCPLLQGRTSTSSCPPVLCGGSSTAPNARLYSGSFLVLPIRFRPNSDRIDMRLGVQNPTSPRTSCTYIQHTVYS